jgi:hypothetical protein
MGNSSADSGFKPTVQYEIALLVHKSLVGLHLQKIASLREIFGMWGIPPHPLRKTEKRRTQKFSITELRAGK